MSMKKILMAAAAVSALTAGSASAASIYWAKFSGVTVTDSVTSANSKGSYRMAAETKLGSGLDSKAGGAITTTNNNNVLSVKMDSGRLSDGSYTVKFDYSGNVKFKNALASADLSVDQTAVTPGGGAAATAVGSSCTVSKTLQSGGGTSANTVTYLVTLSGCTNAGSTTYGPQYFSLNPDFTVTGTGAVKATVTVSQSGSTIDNGPASVDVFTTPNVFSLSATADTTDTKWALGSAGTTPYITLTSDKTLGKYTFATVTGAGGTSTANIIYASADATSQADGLNATATLKVTGDVAVVDVSNTASGGTATAMTAAADKLSASVSGIAKDTDGKITVATPSTALATSQGVKSYQLTVTPVTTSTLITVPAATTIDLQSITLEGTNILAPWVAGSQSPSSTVVRIANMAATDTGLMTLTLKSPIYNSGTVAGATTCNSSKLPALAKIAAGGELVLGVTEMTTCFGDFKRGDLVITTQTPKDNLTAKARLTTASGQISEISLGGLNTGTLAY